MSTDWSLHPAGPRASRAERFLGAIALAALAAACTATASVTRIGPRAWPPRHEGCSVEILASPPARPHEEVGIVSGRTAFTGESLEAMLPEMSAASCRVGAHALVVRQVSTGAAWVRPTVGTASGVAIRFLTPATAAGAVQRRLDASNAHDVEDFVALHAVDVVVTEGADKKVLVSGREALRVWARFNFRRFRRERRALAEVRTEGEKVVLAHEVVSGHAPERPDPWDVGWVRYEVEGELIRRVEFP